MTNRISHFIFAVLLLLCASFAHSQVTVAIAPNMHPQFLNSAGQPLASGFVYTYQAGTTTLLNTYVDSTGTIQNPDPIPLDATGAPSNGSTQTGIWLANTAYKFCAYDVNLVQQWCTDNVTGYLNLLNLPNLWTFQQTFTLPLIDTATDNQLVFGSAGNQTTADFPPPSGNITLHFPNTGDTVVGRNTTDTLAGKTLLLPLFNSSACPITNGPGTYVCVANANSTGTLVNSLVKLANAPSQATQPAVTDTGGALGICVSGCGLTGNATIQESGGPVTCSFDGSVTAGDYVQISSSIAAACHDAGALYPPSGQVLGRVLLTDSGIGNYPVMLFGPEIGGSKGTLFSLPAAATVTGSGTSFQPITSTSFQANALNIAGKTIRVHTATLSNPAGAYITTIYFSFGTSSSLNGTNFQVQSFNSASQGLAVTTMECVVQTTGTSGTLWCDNLQSSQNSAAGAAFITVTANLTVPLFLGTGCTFNTSNASNACTTEILSVEQLN